MRREDRRISHEEALEILKEGQYGILSMCTVNNEGYGIPLNYIFTENMIFFHCADEGSKLDYIRKNNKVTFCVVGNTKILPSKFSIIYESVIVSGSVSEIDGDEKHKALMRFVEKYSGNYIQEGKEHINRDFDNVKVLKLSVESVNGKARKY